MPMDSLFTVGTDYRSGFVVGVRIAGNTISGIEPFSVAGEIELPVIAPGLVDIQVNGYANIDLNNEDLSVNDVRVLTEKLWSVGVTTYLPTLITNSSDRITRLLGTIYSACRSSEIIRDSIGGIHLEGPFISPADGPRGAHPLKFVRAPDWDLFSRWQEAASGMIRIITLSPEWPESKDFISRCVKSGVKVAIGHTSATGDMIRSAVDAGATLSTHLGNASHQMLPRHDNYIWDQLASDELYISMISDGFHLPDAVIKVFLKVKPGKTILVSDSTNFAGMPPGNYSGHIGSEVVLTPQGKLHMKGTPNVLAGSGLSLLHCVNTLVEKKITSLSEAWDMASIRPSDFLALYEKTGLVAGAPADMVFFEAKNKGLSVIKTVKSGITVYEREEH